MASQNKNLRPFVQAAALHISLLVLFALSAWIKPKRDDLVLTVPEIIHATMFNAAEIEAQEQVVQQAKLAEQQAKAAAQQAAEQAEQERLSKQQARQEQAKLAAEEAERETLAKKSVEAAAKAKAEAAEQARAEAAAQAKADAEQAKAAAAKAKAEAAAKAKAEAAEQARAEAAAQAKADAEAAQAKAAAAARAKSELAELAKALKRKVEQSWIRPPDSASGLKCTIRVRLMQDGTVLDAQLVTSSGDDLFDNSAINAVNRASPFKMPSDKELAKEFRQLTFTFNPG